MAELPAGLRPMLVLWDVDHTLIENSGVSKENYNKAFEMLTGRCPEHLVETEGRTDPEVVGDMLDIHGITHTDGYLSRVGEVLESAMAVSLPRLRERGTSSLVPVQRCGHCSRRPALSSPCLPGTSALTPLPSSQPLSWTRILTLT